MSILQRQTRRYIASEINLERGTPCDEGTIEAAYEGLYDDHPSRDRCRALAERRLKALGVIHGEHARPAKD